MRIDFEEQVPVSPEVVFGYLCAPTEWPRLYGSFGEVREIEDGWYAVPMKGDVPDLQARMTAVEPYRRAAWDLRGTLAGKGEVLLEANDEGTLVTGFEEVHVAGLDDPEVLAEMDRGFRKIWQAGWDRLRRHATFG